MSGQPLIGFVFCCLFDGGRQTAERRLRLHSQGGRNHRLPDWMPETIDWFSGYVDCWIACPYRVRGFVRWKGVGDWVGREWLKNFIEHLSIA